MHYESTTHTTRPHRTARAVNAPSYGRPPSLPPSPQQRKPTNDLKIAAWSVVAAVALIATLFWAFDSKRSEPSKPARPTNVFTLGPTGAPPSPPTPTVVTLPAHVFKGVDGKAYAEPGYDWVSAAAGSFEVRWVAGRGHPSFSNITSAQQEGYWNAAPGYTFPSKESLAVVWTPGRAHPEHPHVVAGDLPNKWRAAVGYTWARPNDANSFDVVSIIPAIRPTTLTPLSPRVASGPTEAQMEAAAGKLLLSLLAHAASEEIDSKNLLQDLVKVGLKELRNEAVKSALTDLFPREPRLALEGAANILLLAIDGELSFGNWRSETTRDALALMLEKKSPNLSNAYQVADFIATVAEANKKRRR